ncbi:hypothetical protein [Conchiformibius steedae]|nr:hypothetical protein [Conchiformibius steedae]
MKYLLWVTALALVLAGCARPYAAVNASNHGVSGSVGQTFRW